MVGFKYDLMMIFVIVAYFLGHPLMCRYADLTKCRITPKLKSWKPTSDNSDFIRHLRRFLSASITITIVNSKHSETMGLFMSLVIHYWIGARLPWCFHSPKRKLNYNF